MSSDLGRVAQRKSPIVISYSNPGTKPPIYLAGSFCDWQPQEMRHTIDGQGEYTFTKEVEVKGGKEYQYKFRVGEGDWWLLNEDQPIVTDNIGNRNNLLSVPPNEGLAETDVSADKDSSDISMATTKPMTDDTDNVQFQSAALGRNSRSEAYTQDVASIAAEVADSAVILDRETPTPLLSDEEAGRIGFRRMSGTPIPQVAETAAEVADSAAILDKNDIPKIEMPPTLAAFDFDLQDTASSGAVTPDEDKVPLFAHECIQPPPGGFETATPPKREPIKSKLSIQETAIDFDDPSLEDFPTDRYGILEHFRNSQNRLPEDQTIVEGIPPSPVVGAKPYPEYERLDLPSPSPNFLNPDGPPSLDSIPEDGEEGYREELLSTLPEETNLNQSYEEPHSNHKSGDVVDISGQETEEPGVDVQEVSATASRHQSEPKEIASFSDNPNMDGSIEPKPMNSYVTTSVLESSAQIDDPLVKGIITPEEGPNITVESATPGSSLKTIKMDRSIEPSDSVKTTSIEQGNSQTKLTSRKHAVPTHERAITPTSIQSAGKDSKSRNLLKAIWRIVFLEWIGGLIMRLCGGDRQKALLAISALLLITIAPTVYFAL